MAPFFLVLATLIGVAFFAPLLFLLWIRSRERVGRERLPALFRAFGAGAVLGVLAAVLLATAVSLLAASEVSSAFRSFFPALAPGAFLAVVVAPLAEEPAKAVWLALTRRELREPEDGLVYGAAIGLGFGATENVIYALITLLVAGPEHAAATVAARTLGTVLMHGALTALVGYGATRRLGAPGARPTAAGALPWLGLAILIHAGFNLLASVERLEVNLLAVAGAFALFLAVAHRVRVLDRQLGSP